MHNGATLLGVDIKLLTVISQVFQSLTEIPKLDLNIGLSLESGFDSLSGDFRVSLRQASDLSGRFGCPGRHPLLSFLDCTMRRQVWLPP